MREIIKKYYPVFIIEIACISYLLFQVIFALSRKGKEGVIILIQKYLPFLPNFFTIFIHYFPNWIFTEYGIASFYLFIIVLFFIGYFLSIRKIDKFTPLSIITCSFLFCFSFFFSPPGKHHDIFLYIFQGKIVAHYRANPYYAVPSTFSKDAFYRFVGWKDFPSAYGPFWHWLEALLYLIGGENIISQIAVFRLFIIFIHLANSILIYLILKHIFPDKAKKGMVLMAWNPLLLILGPANATNDNAMIFFMLMGILFSLKNRILIASLFLILSAMIKMFSGIYIPFHLKIQCKESNFFLNIIIMLITLFIIWLPFYQGIKTFFIPFWMAKTSHYSITFLFQSFIEIMYPQYLKIATLFFKLFLSIGFLFFYFYIIRKVNNFNESIRGVSVLFFFLLNVFIPARATWYISWLIPFAILSMERRIIFLTLLLTLTSLLSGVVYYFTHSYAKGYQSISILIDIFIPLTISLIWKIWRNIKNSR
ncbi:MAG: hypothetical protein N2589_04655 [bacterium]|nr:hypothetical protein [bacterium]